MFIRCIPALLLVAFAAVGCAPETRSYTIDLKNNSGVPLTIGLAKDGGPYEFLWASPEDAAMEASAREERVWGRVVPPGKTAYGTPIKGKFDSSSRAMLRVYRGDMPLSAILATSRGDLDRLDLPLSPGANAFIITDPNGLLEAQRLQPPPPSR